LHWRWRVVQWVSALDVHLLLLLLLRHCVVWCVRSACLWSRRKHGRMIMFQYKYVQVRSLQLPPHLKQ
jgi:hypothetical protein